MEETMTDSLRLYLELEAELLKWRAEHPEDTEEEESLSDEMERLWWQLSSDEIAWINQRDGVPVIKP
jgi:hypothetical protein